MPAIQAVKGARDFYPEDLALRRWMYERIRRVSESYGYQEFDGPFLERLELYAAKSGEELVKEQSFVFPDRGGEMITLRPELTLSLARMIAARSSTLPRPIRWWSFGPFWRYERPQKGRAREFYQWNIDLLGPENAQADAEIASVAAALFRAVGLGPDRIRILVNNRRLVDSQLEALGIPADRRPGLLRAIDRRDKTTAAAWASQVQQEGLSAEQFAGLAAMLENKQAWREAPELTAFFDAAETLGASDYLAYDPTVVRGLDYYTGTVFEARDTGGRHRAVLGGGRYDNLVADVGGDPVPGVGFALGDVVLGLVLRENDALPDLRPSPSQVLVTAFDEASIQDSLRLAVDLRAEGLKAEWYPQADRLPKQLKYADRLGIPIALIAGPDERDAGTVTVKDLRSRQQLQVPRAELGRRLRQMLEPPRGS